MEQAPPGWYEGGDGNLRWWDGTAWTAVAPPPARPPSQSNEPVLALIAHISPLAGFALLGPLVVYLVVRNDPERSEWVRAHAREALNFQLTLLVLGIVSVVAVVLVGMLNIGLALVIFVPVWLLLALGSFILMLVATIAAGRGRDYRYPVNIRFVG